MEWIKVTEDSLPKKEIDQISISVLVATETKVVWDAHYNYKEYLWERTYSGEEIHNVTHWMPLPEPPKE